MNLQMGKYLQPTFVIDCDNPTVQKKSKALTRGQEDIAKNAQRLFYFVRDEIKYNHDVLRSRPEHFQASNTLLKKEGYCVQKAVLLVALARSAGIPAGLGFARLRNNLLPKKTVKWLGTNILPFHGYAEFYLNGKWVKATPAFDLKLCENERIVPVEFDGESDAIFHLYNRDGKLHIEYLEDLGRNYVDLPLDKLHNAMIQAWGSKALEPPGRK